MSGWFQGGLCTVEVAWRGAGQQLGDSRENVKREIDEIESIESIASHAGC